MPIEASLLREKATGSGAARWMNCPASVAMSINFEKDEKKYATEGTLAHEWAAKVVTDQAKIEDIENADIQSAVQTYVDTIRSIAGNVECIVEERLPLLGSSGQLDCYCIAGRNAFLFDFKYGVGVRLQALENEQLAFYAVALKEKYPELKTIHCTLVQPRVEGIFEDTPSISSWTLSYQTLAKWRRFFERSLLEVEKAQSIQAGSWCQFCLAKGGCPTHVTYAESVKLEQQGLPGGMIPAPGDAWFPDVVPRVAKILLARKQVESWFNKAEEFLLSLALKGIEVPGFELAKKRSHRKWNIMFTEDEMAEELQKRGIKEPWEKSLMPITRAEKIVDIDDLTEKPEGGPTLRARK